MTFQHTPVDVPLQSKYSLRDNDSFIWQEDYVPCPQGIVPVKCRYTDKFHVYEKDTIIGQALRLYGEYTQVEIDVLNMFINNNSTVYDIGGNIGYHALGFSSKARHVHTFEPNEKNLRLLLLNCGTRDNITIHAVACSDVVGDSFISDYELDGHGNYGECMMSDVGQPCKTIRIDDLDLPHPDVVKIDVEGHELSVFNGMRETIRKSTPVILYESMHGSGFDIIYDFLHDELGYTIYWFPAMNYNPNNFYQNKQNIFGHGGVINCFAIPKRIETEVKGLEPMTDRLDTHIKFIQRMQQRKQ